jgi:sterol desaturase/sphingolipid hydroxylase (fatty acid hydroxylase superfamily)
MELNQESQLEVSDNQKKVFDNKLIQALSRTPIWAPICLFFIISGGLLYWAVAEQAFEIPFVALLFIAGWLFFSLLEYCMHRFLFHMPITTEFRKNVQYGFHGVHHDFPKDKKRLAMPIPLSLTFCVVFFSIFWVIMQENTYGFLPGVLCGYATYLFVHYIVHAYPPPNNLFRALWVNHAIHHYKDDSVVFGVSSQLWDYILGTMPKRES